VLVRLTVGDDFLNSCLIPADWDGKSSRRRVGTWGYLYKLGRGRLEFVQAIYRGFVSSGERQAFGCLPSMSLNGALTSARIPYLFRDTMIRLLSSPKMEFKELIEKSA
jgi:hypothetical protein